ncbi:MAG: ABC transporter substrate-binding protein [Deltaproteobacteria bacterium]|nr:ABC transporter substrate-binding protein [Deltaproteobacteria bacterium]
MNYRIYVISIVCFAAAAFLSCSKDPGADGTIRLGYLQNDLHHLPAFVALEKGLYQKAGLSIEVAGIFRAGPEEMSAFASGDLDLGYVGQAPATAAFLNRVADVKFIAQVNREGSAIVIAKDAQISSLGDLAGKSIAIPGHATMQDFLLKKALKDLSPGKKAVVPIVLKPPEMLSALGLNNIDAFIAWEPYPSQALASGKGRVLMQSSSIWKNHPCCVLVVSAAYCAKYPERIKKIQLVHRQACDYINKNNDAAIDIGMRYTGMNRDVVTRALDNIQFASEINRDYAGAFIDFLIDMRYIKAGPGVRSIKDLFYE